MVAAGHYALSNGVRRKVKLLLVSCISHAPTAFRARVPGFRRKPLAVYGVVSAFADTPWALAAWATMALLVGAATLRLAPASTAQYNPQARSFSLPGSGVPLALMMGIFTTKYAVGVALSLHPALEHDTLVALGISTLYGVFSGSFIARALRLWRLALAAHAAPTAAYAQ